MSKEIVDGSGSFTSSDFGFNHGTWADADLNLLSDILEKVQNGDMINPQEMQEATEIFVRGIENPSTQPEAIGTLMNPDCADLLENTLDHVWLPGLDSDLKDTLVDIAKEPSVESRLQQLGDLIFGEFEQNSSNPTPENLRWPDIWAAHLKRSGTETKEGLEANFPNSLGGDPPTDFDRIQQAYNAGDMARVKEIMASIPDPHNILEEAGSEAWALLLDLAEDPNYENMSQEILHGQGGEIIPILEDIGINQFVVQDLVEWIQTGEKSDPLVLINRQLSNAIAENDVSMFTELVENVPNKNILMQEILDRGDITSPILIEMLGDDNPKNQAFAMDTLHELGSDALDDLTRAKYDSNTTIRDNVERILHYHFTGDSSFESISNESIDNPFATLNQERMGSNELDIDYYVEQLTNPSTCMETLSSLMDVGKPAVPVVYQALVTIRKRKSSVNF